jgi:hypothetical protein
MHPHYVLGFTASRQRYIMIMEKLWTATGFLIGLRIFCGPFCAIMTMVHFHQYDLTWFFSAGLLLEKQLSLTLSGQCI